MKKYLLTALLGSFACIGFASADTVDNFTSESEICTYSFSDRDSVSFDWDSLFSIVRPCSNDDEFYVCISSNDIPYAVYRSSGGAEFNEYVTVSNYCYAWTEFVEDADYHFYNDLSNQDDLNIKSISWKFYFSATPITYSSSSGWSSGWSSSSSWILNSTWQAYLWSVLSGVQSVVTELIPYMVYLALAILVVTLGFIAIKWLMNYTSRRVTGLFSSRRRK